MKNELVTLNPHSPVFEDEYAIDCFSTGMGGYCGSISVPKKDAERIAYALNMCGSLLIKGVQTNYSPIHAKIRNEKQTRSCPRGIGREGQSEEYLTRTPYRDSNDGSSGS